MSALIGEGIDRVDGRLKVTGRAKYAAEFALPDMTHAVIVQATIGRGTIKSMDTDAAEASPGVLAVLTAANTRPKAKVPAASPTAGGSQMPGADVIFQTNRVMFYGQHIAVVVAETLEQAQHAASLIKTEYDVETPSTDLMAKLDSAVAPKGSGNKLNQTRGDMSAAASAPVSIKQTYSTPNENHNPMEMHATTAKWDNGKLTLWDATQAISGTQMAVAHALKLDAKDIRVIDPFVGGGFGCKGTTWPHVALTAQAARHVGRPVRLMLTRAQMFTSVGYRSRTRQTISLSAGKDGKLVAGSNDTISQSPEYSEFVETATKPFQMLYAMPNMETSQKLVHVDTQQPTYMRAPGESTGGYAMECAMDELAYELKIDPVQLRLINYAETDPSDGKPWSSKSLKECYAQASEKFGWSKRSPEVKSMRDGNELVGYGMATATYPASRMPASARVRIYADGSIAVQSGTQDLGTGTYTVMCQTAADSLGVDPKQVKSQLGDTNFPKSGVSGGSATAASVGSAVKVAADQLRDLLVKLSTDDTNSPLHGLSPTEVTVTRGRLISAANPAKYVELKDVVVGQGKAYLETLASPKPSADSKNYAMHAFGAVFAEVRVDPVLGRVRLERLTAAYGCGKIINAKTARSQFIGGLVFGVGMALHEDTVTDHRTGQIVNASLADYLVPVNADVRNIDIIEVPEVDPHVNELGVKGVGEIGIVGAPAAIANAIYHATGLRVRDLPITPDKLLA